MATDPYKKGQAIRVKGSQLLGVVAAEQGRYAQTVRVKFAHNQGRTSTIDADLIELNDVGPADLKPKKKTKHFDYEIPLF